MFKAPIAVYRDRKKLPPFLAIAASRENSMKSNRAEYFLALGQVLGSVYDAPFRWPRG